MLERRDDPVEGELEVGVVRLDGGSGCGGEDGGSEELRASPDLGARIGAEVESGRPAGTQWYILFESGGIGLESGVDGLQDGKCGFECGSVVLCSRGVVDVESSRVRVAEQLSDSWNDGGNLCSDDSSRDVRSDNRQELKDSVEERRWR